jgi:hypothetical protein
MPKRGRALGKRDKPVKSHSRDRRERDFRPTILANATDERDCKERACKERASAGARGEIMGKKYYRGQTYRYRFFR